jgi:hypothetical protein
VHKDLWRSRQGGAAAGGPPQRLTPAMWPDIARRLASETTVAIADDLGVRRQTLWSFRRRMEREAALSGDRNARLHPRNSELGSMRNASAKSKT